MGNLTCINRTDVSLQSMADQTNFVVNKLKSSLHPSEGINIKDLIKHMH